MAKVRIGFSSDFALENSEVGIGTTNPTAKLQVVGTLKGDFNITGVSTLRSYGGFIAQKQNITKASAIGFGTVGLQTAGPAIGVGATQVGYSYYETETGYTSLVGEYNTLSDDLIVDDGKIFEIKTTSIIGVTTIGTQSYDYDTSRVDLGTLESISIQSHFTLPNGGIETRPENPIEGTVRFNDDLNTLEFYNGIEWRQFTVTGASGRGVFPGGADPSATSSIDYINISTQGNALNFGSLDTATQNVSKASSEIRGIVYGGNNTTTSIDYITIASEGNAIDFGTCTASLAAGGCSSSTRAVFGGGTNPGLTNHIEYIQINTLGNGVLFGDLTQTRSELGGVSSPTRGVFAGGGAPSGSAPSSTIDFITIASIGDAIDFGDLIDRCGQLGGGCGNSTRGLFAGGAHAPKYLDIIQYITIATTGNATYFGDMSIPRVEQAGAASNSTRGTLVGGYTPGGDVNSIDYVTIASTGNAQDFGDLTVAKSRIGGGQISDSHGGLGGF